MSSLLRRSTAEALGTFSLVFISTAVIVVRGYPDAQSGLLGTALAQAMVLSIMITATMGISGGYLNPAVTVGLLVARRVSPRTAGAYIVAQLVGAVLGALMLKAIFPANILRGQMYGTPTIVGTMTLGQAMVVEGVLTFFLVSAVFGTCVNPDAHKVGGFAVGLVLVFDILVGGALTGSAVNPARAFGPALVSGQWIGHIVYWVGPLLGGIVAAGVWEYWLLRKETR
jgi:aquaporin TIP